MSCEALAPRLTAVSVCRRCWRRTSWSGVAMPGGSMRSSSDGEGGQCNACVRNHDAPRCYIICMILVGLLVPFSCTALSDLMRCTKNCSLEATIVGSSPQPHPQPQPKQTSQKPMLPYCAPSLRPAAFSMQTSLTASHSRGGYTAKCCSRATSSVVKTALQAPHSVRSQSHYGRRV